MSLEEGYKRNNKKEFKGNRYCDHNMAGITVQGLYCYLDMGNNTVMYYKCSHVVYALHKQTSLVACLLFT